MDVSELFDTTPSPRQSRSKVIRYGGVGAASVLIIQLAIGFATDHSALVALSVALWWLFSSVLAWTLWEFVIPIAVIGDPANTGAEFGG